MAAFLQQIEQWGIFTQIRNSSFLYGGLLWLHILALIAWGGALLRTDWAGPPVDDLRSIQRVSLAIASFAGLLLFGAKAAEYAYNPWFWGKLGLLVLLGVNRAVLRRSRPRLAGGLSLVLCVGAIAAARGPATVKDIMGSMVDPSADFLFASVRIVSDESGPREIAPHTEAEWQEVRSRVDALWQAQNALRGASLRGARPRDRSKNPQVENEAAEIQQLLDANPADFSRRAQALGDAAEVAMRAVDGRDKDALLRALEGIDRACEVCHLTYWYPRDQRAREAAKASGILE